jgi:hypothetical protein
MAAYRHCKHCWGACDGGCLLPGDTGACIHSVGPPFRQRVWLWLVKRGRLRTPG